MEIILFAKNDFGGADVDRWEGVTMEFMSHAVSARFRGSLTCVGPFQTGLSQSGFVKQNFQTLQVYNTKTGGVVDILEDFLGDCLCRRSHRLSANRRLWDLCMLGGHGNLMNLCSRK